MAEAKQTEKLEFQSEVKKLLDILVYSLYQHKEVFLRELISNSADALSKVRFSLLTQQDVVDKDEELRISISLNEKSNTLVVEDTGVGMTREELIGNLGTIAHSGTLDFLKEMNKEKHDAAEDLIGQFGVGFYASFMVAEEIRVTSLSAKPGEKAWLWTSRGDTSYTIEETVKKQRGTRIELVLKEDEKEFLKKGEIERIINAHSRFVPFPIYIEKEKVERIQAIWSQPKGELKDQDYLDFYKSLPVMDDAPLTHLHLSVDAPVQFQALLYVPETGEDMLGMAPTDPGVDLYSKKILIQTGNKEILPEYFRFIKGVVDSEELPLNISRETVQSHGKVKKIQTYLVRKLIEHLTQIKKEEPEKYRKIWDAFSRYFKEGILKDWESREKLAPLLMFETSTHAAGDLIDLDTAATQNEGKQDKIYYIAGGQRSHLESNPALEAFREQNLPVLLLTEPIDEFVVENLREYQKKPFTNILGADVKIDRPDKGQDERDKSEPSADLPGLIGYLKTTFAAKVADVRASERLVNSPCLLVIDGKSPSAQMEKLLKMTDKNYQFQKRILEINPENALIRSLAALHEKEPLSPKLKVSTQMLVDLALLKEGLLESVDEIMPDALQLMSWAAGEPPHDGK
jgi:molecular chaperone HtpG